MFRLPDFRRYQDVVTDLRETARLVCQVTVATIASQLSCSAPEMMIPLLPWTWQSFITLLNTGCMSDKLGVGPSREVVTTMPILKGPSDTTSVLGVQVQGAARRNDPTRSEQP